jgi:hypothetical protein
VSSPRGLLTTFLDGGIPDRTPYSIYSWFFEDPRYPVEAWKPLLERGLGVSTGCGTVRHIEHGVKNSEETWQDANTRYIRRRKETPAGTLQQVVAYPLGEDAGILGWTMEEWIKTPQDYNIRRWIIEHTELETQYDTFDESEHQIGNQGVTIVSGSRTPIMSILVDWAGTERFCLDVAEGVDELFHLYEAQKKLFLAETRLIAAGPGRFVRWLENLTISTLGPKRYEKLVLPVYQEAVPMLQAAGKRVMVHYDGALRSIREQIAGAPFHMIESLTEPPEGDMTYDACRAAWPEKGFWANINVELYGLPPEQLAEAVIARRERAGKRAFAFEISEDVPVNWRQSVPVVLDTLEKLG